MIILITPAKRMRPATDFMDRKHMPCFLPESERLVTYLEAKKQEGLKAMLNYSDVIAEWTYNSYQHMDVNVPCMPTLLSFDGIQYSYIAPDLFSEEYFAYTERHLHILSGLYGILEPFDDVVSYRLELDSPFHTPFCTGLYDFWGSRPYRRLTKEDKQVLDLSSKQHDRLVKRHLGPDVHLVSVYFLEREEGKRREEGVYVKMTRGEMVRWSTERDIRQLEDVKHFCRLGYRFDIAVSDDKRYRSIRKTDWKRGKYEAV